MAKMEANCVAVDSGRGNSAGKKERGSNLLAQPGTCESQLLPFMATLPLLGIVGLVDVCRKSPISSGGVIALGVWVVYFSAGGVVLPLPGKRVCRSS